MNRIRQSIVALATGMLAGFGLCVAQMVDPAKVLNFLDVFGSWDPSLAFVMGGGLAVNGLLTAFILKRSAPVFAGVFHLPSLVKVDRKIVIGGLLFGIGWGLAGYCPGPIITSMSFVDGSILTIACAYVAGTFLARFALARMS